MNMRKVSMLIVMFCIAATVAITQFGYQQKPNKNDNIVMTPTPIEEVTTPAPAPLDITNTPVLRYYLSASEMELLQKIVYAEAGNSSLEAQISVCAVILNRMDATGKSLYDVVFQKGQFEPAQDGEIYTGRGDNKKVVTLEMIQSESYSTVEEAISRALEGEDPTKDYLGEGALFFFQPEALSEEELMLRYGIKNLVQIGTEVFFREWN